MSTAHAYLFAMICFCDVIESGLLVVASFYRYR
jgi:hypothetical protein